MHAAPGGGRATRDHTCPNLVGLACPCEADASETATADADVSSVNRVSRLHMEICMDA